MQINLVNKDTNEIFDVVKLDVETERHLINLANSQGRTLDEITSEFVHQCFDDVISGKWKPEVERGRTRKSHAR